jgi:hypothetical protein
LRASDSPQVPIMAYVLHLWFVVLLALMFLFIFAKIFDVLDVKVGPRCSMFFEYFFALTVICSVIFSTCCLIVLALRGFGFKIKGIDTINYANPAAAITVSNETFIDLPPVSAIISEGRNYNLTIMNFDKFVPTYYWSKEYPFKTTAVVGQYQWGLEVWNTPEENVNLEVIICTCDCFYYSSFYELKIVNRDTGNVTFKEGGVGQEWGRISMTKELLERSLDKDGSLHFMISFTLNGDVNQDAVRRIVDEEGNLFDNSIFIHFINYFFLYYRKIWQGRKCN